MDGPTYTRQWEGNRITAYQDEFGNWTIGIGHKLGQGNWAHLTWMQSQIDTQFANDYADAEEGVQQDIGNLCWANLNDCRQAVLTDMAFNIGIDGLKGFHKMISALLIEDWQNAAAEILNSERAKQLAKRSASNAQIMSSGEWPNG